MYASYAYNYSGRSVRIVRRIFWQRIALLVLILLNSRESYVLFRQRSFLALLNSAMALVLLVALFVSWPGKRGDLP
jgi:hypothetical protein